jgi:ABC-type nitrate/sulfonate/bicarbonate transport system substrate-binding protein
MMTTIQVGFKAFDPHELLCHFVAVNAGLYKHENIDVELIDITFVADTELPSHVCQVSCGAALGSALRGIPQRILFVATDKPMFWIYSSNKIRSIRELAKSKIATFPAAAPPHHLANTILRKYGINVEQDVVLLPARDDVARFGLLASGHVDAAVISSAIAPAKFAQTGKNMLCFFGDEIRIPTTGLAVDQAYLEKETVLIKTLVNILKRSLSIIHEDQDTVARALKEYFGVDEGIKKETAEILQNYYTVDGWTTQEIAQNAIHTLCKSLSISTIPDWRQIYKQLDRP